MTVIDTKQALQNVNEKLSEVRFKDQEKLVELEKRFKLASSKHQEYKQKLMTADQEKDSKLKELEVLKKQYEDLKKLPNRIEELKDKGDSKELLEKYEKLKIKYNQIDLKLVEVQKEAKVNLRKAEEADFRCKEAKDQLTKIEEEAKGKDQIIDDIYGQIDQMAEGQAQYDTKIEELINNNTQLKKTSSEIENREIQSRLENNKMETEYNKIKAEMQLQRQEIDNKQEVEELVKRQTDLHKEMQDQQKKVELIFS
jgi:chromosome segregation ATPase